MAGCKHSQTDRVRGVESSQDLVGKLGAGKMNAISVGMGKQASHVWVYVKTLGR